MGSSGDDDFYELFLLPLEDRMLRTAWRIVRHPARAQDALQEAMTVLWTRRERIRAHPRPDALILRICIDASIDVLRKEAKHQRRRVIAEVDAVPAPTRTLESGERESEVLAAIGRLGGNQATAVFMRIVEEREYSEIALALQCSETTARIHVMRGRARLQRMLGHLVDQDER
jgi:RNA polymerase sigma-70 factor (ECF subfamily)